jgi:hypothetical protein
MADQWFCAMGGQELGPLSAAQLKRLAADGQLQASDLVWKAGTQKRVPAKAVKGLFAGAATGAAQQGQARAAAY